MNVGHILIHNPFFSSRVAMGDHKLEPAESHKWPSQAKCLRLLSACFGTQEILVLKT